MDRELLNAYMDEFTADLYELEQIEEDFQDWVIEHESQMEPVASDDLPF